MQQRPPSGDPDRNKRGTLDKFLLKPGIYVSPPLTPTQPQSLQYANHGGDGCPQITAAVDCSHTSDDIPFVRPLAFQPTKQPAPERKFRIKHLSAVEWDWENETIEARLKNKLPTCITMGAKPRSKTISRTLHSVIKGVLKPEFGEMQPR